MKRSHPRRRLRKWQNILIYLIAIALSASISTIATGRDNPNNREIVAKAPIILDGRELFKIDGLGKLTASERADKISNLLQNKLQSRDNLSSESLKIEIVKKPDWTVLRLGNRHLITVAETETIPGMGADEQALIWREKIQSGLKRGIEERSPQFRRWIAKIIAIALLMVIAAEIGLFCLKRRCRRKLLDSKAKKRYSWAILGILTLQVAIWSGFVYYIFSFFPLTRHGMYLLFNFLDDNFNAEIIDLGGETLISPRHITTSILLGIGWLFFVTWLSRLLKQRLLPLTAFEDTLQNSIIFFIRYGLLFIGLLLILNFGGIDFRSLAIVLSALGVGIGFGLQNIAKDFISGVILTLTRPIKIGELVEVGEYKGLVMRIGARTTDISHVDRHIMTIPNSRFIEDTVKNWNRSGLNRVKIYVDVAYDSDRDLVYKALLSAAQVYHPDILRHPPPKVKLRDFGERSLLFRVVVFIQDPLKEPKVRNHIQLNVDKNLRKYKIEIPFPQRDIHLKVPQLENLVANLTQRYTPDRQQIYYPDSKIIKKDPRVLATLEELAIRDEYNWDELVSAMHGENGLNIKDRRYGLKTYRQVFAGNEAVNWLIEKEKATRSEAIAIGKLMVKQQIIHHVLDEHDFEDEALFYRFYLDERDEETDWESNDN